MTSSWGNIPEVTDYQFSVAVEYLDGDKESLLELLEMKIRSNIYNLLKYEDIEGIARIGTIQDGLNLAQIQGVLSKDTPTIDFGNKGDRVYSAPKPFYNKSKY